MEAHRELGNPATGLRALGRSQCHDTGRSHRDRLLRQGRSITQWNQPGMISPEERGAASAGAGAVRSYDVNATARFRLLRPELGDQPARPGAVTQQPGYLRVTRKMDPFASSLTSSAPSRVTATPAGRAQTVSLSSTKPVTKSSYSPVGLPSFMRTRITL